MSQIQSVFKEAIAPFADKRIHLCDLTAKETNSIIMLAGTVLDDETITAVAGHLRINLPKQAIDSSEVKILRQSQPTLFHTSTTITTLYDTPGFLSKPSTQLLNGQVLEFLQEKGSWVFVRQVDGYLGWVYRPYLTESASLNGAHWVCEPVGLLRNAPDEQAPLVSRVLGGTAVSCNKQEDGWATIDIAGGLTGWLPTTNLRAQDNQPQDEESLRTQLVTDAYKLMGVPYLWAGCSAYGIDCSGFSQWVHRLSGIELLRDADMQMENGRVVESSYQPGDLFFFGQSGDHRQISHVGISLGGWEMIHASRSKNGVYVDSVQEVEHLRESFLGARTYVA